MAIIRWKPLDDMEKFFDQAFGLPRSGLDLAADVYEEGNNVIAEMSAPEVDPEKIEISIDGDMLHVKGSREEKKEETSKNYYSKEIRRGSFERSICLPRAVVGDKATASYKDGMLKVTMVARDTAKPIKVKVKTEK